LPPDVTARSFSRAIAWAAGSQFSQQLIQLPVTIVLSRLLLPRDFGLMAMVLVISQFLVVFVDAGLGAALVHIKVLEQRHISSAFWLNLAGGTFVTIVIAAAAPGVAWLYGEPRLTWLVVVVSVNFVVSSVSIVPIALLQRQMDLRRIAKIQNLAAVAGGAAGIAAAISGAGVWSLVVDVLTTSSAQSMLAMPGSNLHIRYGVDRLASRELWRFGGGQLGFQLVNYWSRNADNLLIGEFVGPRGLGLYDRAYQLMLLPLTQAGFVVSYVLYPALARIQHDHARLKRAYVRTVGVTALVTFPVATGLFVVAPDLVTVLFGPHWYGVAKILRILCLAGLLQSIGTTTGVIYQTQGRTDWLFRWGLVSAVSIVGAFVIGTHWGVDGVAIAYSALALPLAYFNFAIPGRLIGLSFHEILRVTWAPLLCAGLMGLAMWLIGQGLDQSVPVAARLVIDVGLGAAIYLALVHVARLTSYRDVRSLLRRADRAANSSRIDTL
jgi:PST family polysaccharide transporter